MTVDSDRGETELLRLPPTLPDHETGYPLVEEYLAHVLREQEPPVSIKSQEIATAINGMESHVVGHALHQLAGTSETFTVKRGRSGRRDAIRARAWVVDWVDDDPARGGRNE